MVGLVRLVWLHECCLLFSVGKLDVGILIGGSLEDSSLPIGNMNVDILMVGNFDVDVLTVMSNLNV
jgi:hypothetical protein